MIIFPALTFFKQIDFSSTMRGVPISLFPDKEEGEEVLSKDLRQRYLDEFNPKRIPAIAALQGIRYAAHIARASMLDRMQPAQQDLEYLQPLKSRLETIALQEALRDLELDALAYEKVIQFQEAYAESKKLSSLAQRASRIRARGVESEGAEKPASLTTFHHAMRPGLKSLDPSTVLRSAATQTAIECIGTNALGYVFHDSLGEFAEPSLSREAFRRPENRMQCHALRRAIISHGVPTCLSAWILDEELRRSAIKSSHLKRQNPRERYLITDSAIPKPTLMTIDGWVSYGLIHFSTINRKEKGKSRASAILISIQSPTMPRTLEHNFSGGVIDTSGVSSHSLPSRSAGHKRFATGGIDYGIEQQELWRIDLDENKAEFLARTNLPSDSHPAQIHQTLLDKVNLGDDEKHLQHPDHRMAMTPGVATWSDPYLDDESQAMPRFWFLANDPYLRADLPYRYLAKQGQHFRFDNSKLVDSWFEAFAGAYLQRAKVNQTLHTLALHTYGTVQDLIDINDILATAGTQRVKLSF